MADPVQGEIWWAALPAPSGRRPVLVLTRSRALRVLTNVTVAPLTRSGRGVEAEVALERADGVPTACVITLENILTVRKVVLDRRIATLSQEKMRSVFEAIRFVFDMPD